MSPVRAVSVRAGAAMLALIGLAGGTQAQTPDGAFQWQGNGLKLETAPLPGDQVIAFFLARGFDSETAGMIARQGCIFRSAIGADDTVSPGVQVSVDLSRWRVVVDDRDQRMRTRQQWAQVLADRQVDPGAAIALEWALFPTRQDFGRDDYNWGLLSFALPPGSRFDLVFSWATDGAEYEQRFNKMECAG